MKRLRVALIHNLKPIRKDPKLPADYYSECDSKKTVRAIAKALRAAGHQVLPVQGDERLPVWLTKNRVDVAFNIAEGFQGESREARVPALLDLLNVPYTGSGVLTQALALNKAKSKQLFRCAGIPTPNFQLFTHSAESLNKSLHFPLIVKPNCEGSGKGIWASSVVFDEKALRAQVKQVLALYAQEVIIEEYIEGMELTVGVLGTEQALPILEVDFSECKPSGEYFYSWRMKEYQGNKQLFLNPRFWCPARLSREVTQAVSAVALKAAQALGTRDLARVDIRLSLEGIPYVLEVNPLPGLDPEESNLPLMLKAVGIPYEGFIQRILNFALERTPELQGKVFSAPMGFSSIPSYKKLDSKVKPPKQAVPDSVELKPSGNSVDDDAAVVVRSAVKKRSHSKPSS